MNVLKWPLLSLHWAQIRCQPLENNACYLNRSILLLQRHGCDCSHTLELELALLAFAHPRYSRTHVHAPQAAISGFVFALGDLTAQAYEGAGVSSIDWARTARSGAVGVIQGPLGHAVFSSDGCLIDRFVEQQVGTVLYYHLLVRLHAPANAPAEQR